MGQEESRLLNLSYGLQGNFKDGLQAPFVNPPHPSSESGHCFLYSGATDAFEEFAAAFSASAAVVYGTPSPMEAEGSSSNFSLQRCCSMSSCL